MISETIAAALVFGLLALSRKSSGAAVGILIASMLIWPEYLRIPIGLIEASAPRLVALALVMQALIRGKHRIMTGCHIDRIVLAIWAWTILASVIAGAAFSQAAQMIGRGLDTVLMYFVVRICITSVEDLKGMVRWLAVALMATGSLGVIESTTGHSLYSGMEATWHWIAKEDQYRYGFLRAKGSTSIHIYFGMSMMLITGMLWSINKVTPEYRIGRWGVIFGVLGTLSSVSSGPWIGCALMFVFGLYRIKPTLIRPTVYFIVLLAISLELASNRHFYNLIDYFALDPHTAWYRTRLVEIAASHLSEFWLVGVGSNWPHYWGALLDGRDHIDVVNHFLIVALYGGLPAMFLYIATHWIAISYIVLFWRSDNDRNLRIVAFNLGCALLALDFSSLSVGLYGPPQLLSYILLSLIVVITKLYGRSEVAHNY